MDPVESIDQDVAHIEGQYEAEKGKLFTPRGEPYNADETHKRLLADVEGRRWEQLERTLTRHEEQATRKAEAARQELAPLAGDPITRLPADQLQRAAALATFIREDAESLPAHVLRERIEHARASGDPALASLYARYGAQRAERDMRQALEAGAGADRDVLELESAIAALQSGLVDEKTRAKIVALQQELGRAVAAQTHARLLRERKRPGGKEEFAALLGVNPRYVEW